MLGLSQSCQELTELREAHTKARQNVDLLLRQTVDRLLEALDRLPDAQARAVETNMLNLHGTSAARIVALRRGHSPRDEE